MQISSVPMESLAQILTMQMETGGVARLVVTGDSMYPTFRNRKDVVYLSSDTGSLKKKDLILYQRDSGQYVLHRIVSRPKNGAFICCGDNQWEKEPITARQVVAVVIGFRRKGKEQTPDTFGYRAWVNLWVGLFPLRRPLLAIRRWLGRIRRKTYTL